MTTRLFVGNLSYNTNEDQLRDVFGAIGNAVEVKVVTDRETGRPRGFAFVEMSSGAEAQSAIEQLNGRELDGRTITVNQAEARPAKSSSRGPGGGGRRW